MRRVQAKPQITERAEIIADSKSMDGILEDQIRKKPESGKFEYPEIPAELNSRQIAR